MLIAVQILSLVLSAPTMYSDDESPSDDEVTLPAEAIEDKQLGPCDEWSTPNSCYVAEEECYLLVLMCTTCCYDDVGIFEKKKTDSCGVCAGIPF